MRPGDRGAGEAADPPVRCHEMLTQRKQEPCYPPSPRTVVGDRGPHLRDKSRLEQEQWGKARGSMQQDAAPNMADATLPLEPIDPQYGTRQRLEALFDNFWHKLEAKMIPTASTLISERRKSNKHGATKRAAEPQPKQSNSGLPAQNRREVCKPKPETKPASPIKKGYKAATLTTRHPSGLGAQQGLTPCRPYTRGDTRDRENARAPEPTTVSGRLHGHKARALAKARSQRSGKSSRSRNTRTVRRVHYHIETPARRSNKNQWTLPRSTTYDLWTLPLSTTYASLAGTKNIPTMGVG
ncbi:Hypothetical predicted protein [Pelobates cultripes]|uniref:Uncharacterized protein n=1 Tax=Pelobates cultripes TaxID=61616 RepID=A0AAD1S3C9_PELCU|nr:Hypothetical predicted protein [Pelobates cultripes]